MLFVRLLLPWTFLGTRRYPADAVVAVEDARGKSLILAGHALAHPGPAFDPSAPEPSTVDLGPHLESGALDDEEAALNRRFAELAEIRARLSVAHPPAADPPAELPRGQAADDSPEDGPEDGPAEPGDEPEDADPTNPPAEPGAAPRPRRGRPPKPR